MRSIIAGRTGAPARWTFPGTSDSRRLTPATPATSSPSGTLLFHEVHHIDWQQCNDPVSGLLLQAASDPDCRPRVITSQRRRFQHAPIQDPHRSGRCRTVNLGLDRLRANERSPEPGIAGPERHFRAADAGPCSQQPARRADSKPKPQRSSSSRRSEQHHHVARWPERPAAQRRRPGTARSHSRAGSNGEQPTRHVARTA